MRSFKIQPYNYFQVCNTILTIFVNCTLHPHDLFILEPEMCTFRPSPLPAFTNLVLIWGLCVGKKGLRIYQSTILLTSLLDFKKFFSILATIDSPHQNHSSFTMEKMSDEFLCQSHLPQQHTKEAGGYSSLKDPYPNISLSSLSLPWSPKSPLLFPNTYANGERNKLL